MSLILYLEKYEAFDMHFIILIRLIRERDKVNIYSKMITWILLTHP